MRRSQAKKDEAAMARLYELNDSAGIENFKAGYRQGIRAAAEVAQGFQGYIPFAYRFEDLILSKFNLITNKERRKRQGEDHPDLAAVVRRFLHADPEKEKKEWNAAYDLMRKLIGEE